MRSAPLSTVARLATAPRWSRDGDRIAALAGAAMLAVWAGNMMLADNATSERDKAAGSTQTSDASVTSRQAEYVVAGYGGAPYTHPSDVKVVKPGDTDLTVEGVRWEGRPFKAPVYYGIRTVHWTGGGTFGSMLDFTHSKTISQPDQAVRLTGTRKEQTLTGKSRLEDVFRRLEFSHGHNTLTVNGMVRLANLLPALAPYVGGGVGVALPHTEVHLQGDATRTYEYQYVGPAAQVVLGLELRVPHVSLFLEYKFTIASYKAPLTGRDGGWFPGDFWRQARDIWQGVLPAGGYLSTTLASHQVASGAGLRILRAPAQPVR